jgi:ubiquinone/menaquinone biosynthesis C-methylase UbiE
MGFYADRILPHLIHLAMRQETFLPYRQRLVDGVRGRVLEVGIGSGLNVALYPAAADAVVGLDPSSRLLRRARGIQRPGESLDLLEGVAEALPLDDQTFDTVVSTWTLCSIPDVNAALREIRRVLKPSGQFLFVEHGRAPDARVALWQDRLTPMWKRLAGGCHLNRPIRQLVEDAGFDLARLETGYMGGPTPMTYMYEGVARPV